MTKTLLLTSTMGIGLASTSIAEPEFSFSAYSTFSFGVADDEEETHATHAHDPNDNFTLQGLEFSAGAQLTEQLGLYANYNSFLDEDDKYTGEWEDIFTRFSFFDQSLNIRAGRIFNSTNEENTLHSHAWEFVNSSLLTTQFGGDEGLLTEGVEVAWALPILNGSIFSVSFGDGVEHDHEHGGDHDHGDDHGDDDDDHGDEDGDHDEEHGEIEGDAVLAASDIFTVSFRGTHSFNDFHHLNYRLHHTFGENETGGDTNTTGLGLQYEWREGGSSDSQSYLKVGVEWITRDIEFLETNEDFRDNGYALKAIYGFNSNWQLGARYEFVEGLDEVEESAELGRASLAATRFFELTNQIDGRVKLQLDHEDREFGEDSQAAWLQFVFAFGANH